MTSILDSFLETHQAVVLDGGFATELERKNIDISGRLWSTKALVNHQEAIFQIHKEYLEAGAQIITTSSYQASLQGFVKLGISNGRKYLERSVQLALSARDIYCDEHSLISKPLVAATAGNYGAFLCRRI